MKHKLVRATPAHLALAIVTSLALCMLTIAVLVVVDQRHQVQTQVEENARNLLNAVSRDFARSIETLDLSIIGAVEGLARKDVMALRPELRDLVLFDRSASASNLGDLVVYNASGEAIIKAGEGIRSIAPSIISETFFEAHRQRGVGLFVSEPYQSQLAGRNVVALSRRVDAADGSFGGVVVASIELAYFFDLLERLELGPGSVVSLIRNDGVVIVRRGGGTNSEFSQSFAASPVFQRIFREGSGSFVGKSRLDDVERLYNFGRVGDLPLVLTMNLSTNQIYAEWRNKAYVTLGALGILCSILILVSIVLFRELGRRGAAEQALKKANDELFGFSMTDVLTGLGNRRYFDDILRREVGRAARNRRSLSLILLDVDHFKSFNDHHGHQEGDHVLKIVARSLLAALRRDGDMAFRVGGEEFAIILPDTSAHAAAQVAENIRSEIGHRRVAHNGISDGRLTVSLGIAGQGDEHDPEKLFRRADRALYKSKDDGRDRVTIDEVFSFAA